MIRVLPHVLSSAELQAVRELLPQVRFGDGRVTNPDSAVKQNLQAPQEDPANARIAHIAREALTLGAAKLPIKTKIVTRLGAAAEA